MIQQLSISTLLYTLHDVLLEMWIPNLASMHTQCEVLPRQDTSGTGFVGLCPYKISCTIRQPSSQLYHLLYGSIVKQLHYRQFHILLKIYIVSCNVFILCCVVFLVHSSVRSVLVVYPMHCRNSLLDIRKCSKKLYKHVCLGIL